ncbi:MAG: rhomboid family intramembrane serine protease [Cyanobacteria bacterium REEB459]|nr:rhomboid family intramembrane serine protease [Cyanobacteria bacterium REEB459]
MNPQEETRALTQELKLQFRLLGGLVAIMWVVEWLDHLVFRGQLNGFGIIPRTSVGLRGILFAPFLHLNFAHLLGNTIPFLVLGWLIMLRQTGDFIWVTLIVGLASGLGTWIFGSAGTHIGASGVVFGYLGYLLSRGIFERRLGSICLSLFVATVYGSLIWGILPLHRGISWEGHLFGFLGGILAARNLSSRRH